VPGSLSLELEAPPEVVLDSAAGLLRANGLAVALADRSEGYLESGWYDVIRKAPARGAGSLDDQVKLRFFADPTAGHTRLAAECVRRLAYDPSEPERDLERMVPDSTPGRVLLDSIVARLKAAWPLAETTTPKPGSSPQP